MEAQSIQAQIEAASQARDAAAARVANLEREQQVAEAVDKARNDAENKIAIAAAKAEHPDPAEREQAPASRDGAVAQFIAKAVESGNANAFLAQMEKPLFERFSQAERLAIYSGITKAQDKSAYLSGFLIRRPEGVEPRASTAAPGFTFSKS